MAVMTKRRELSAERKADAERLRAIWDTRFKGKISQMEAADRCGWNTQGAFSQYMHGRIPLNLEALLRISKALDIKPADISPGLAGKIEFQGATRSDPQGAKDELTMAGNFEAWDGNSGTDNDEIELPLFREVELAAGSGRTQVQENKGAKLKFAKSSLRKAGVPEEAAACAYVNGNSMEPVLQDGATVGVNTADTQVRDGKLYALDHEGMLRIKQLKRIPGGGLRLVSFNKAEHPDEEYTPEEVAESIRIIGRVFWYATFL